jgi:nucleotide sugar dehydrogenase
MELFELPQVISGYDVSTADRAGQLFKTLTSTIVNVQTLETAEMVKLASNMWRDFSFSFANELFMSTENLHIDITEVISAANLHYPRSAIPFPGAVGGPCLTKDTYIFSQSISNNAHLFASARIVNENFPRAVVNRLKFATQGSVGIIGWAFKGEPRTTDLRFSPTLDYLDLILKLTPKEISIKAWDPESIDIDKRPSNVEWCDSLSELLTNSNSLIIANNHPYFRSDEFFELIASHSGNLTIADLWGLISKDRVFNKNIELLNLGNI